MDLAEVTERFLALERERDLLERRVGGVPVWERVRFDVHRALLRELGLAGQAHDPDQGTTLSRLGLLLRNLVHRNPFLAPPRDTLVWGHERRKQVDGEWWDVYVDPLVEGLDADWVHVESPHADGHPTPARTDGLRYLDVVEYAPGILERLPVGGVSLSSDERAWLDGVEAVFEAEFGVRPPVRERVERVLRERRAKLPLYRALLRRVDPDLALVVVSYVRESFVEACQREGVPVVELQHGVLGEYHLGYAYPGDRTKETAPDYLLSFGEFWTEAVDFPVPAGNVHPVGYPYLERRAAALDRVGSEEVLFVSQGPVGEALSRFAIAFAERTDRPVAYKLHPGEYDRWERDYPHLVDAARAGTLAVRTDDPTLYEQFAAADAQVGVFSTALYEGLQFGLSTYTVDVPGTAYLDRLVASGAARRVGTPAALEAALEEDGGPTDVDTDRFFQPNAVENARSALADIREREGRRRGDTGR